MFMIPKWAHIPTYKCWDSIKQRCLNPSCRAYKNYGGRGIKIDYRWLDFHNFVEDMGNKPDGFTIDRKNNSKGYSKSNCRWANYNAQNRNRRKNKLKAEDISEIKRMKIEGFKQCDIATRFNVSTSMVSQILNGFKWGGEETIIEKGGE